MCVSASRCLTDDADQNCSSPECCGQVNDSIEGVKKVHVFKKVVVTSSTINRYQMCYKLQAPISQMLCSVLFMHVWFLFPPLLRIRTKIVDPYNKIVARTAQLARLQVILLLLRLLLSSHIWIFQQNYYFFTVLLYKHCAPSLRGLISMFIGLTSEIETILPSQWFAVKTDSVKHPACGNKEREMHCTQTHKQKIILVE